MPRLFFRDVEQAGVYAFHAALADALGPQAPPLLLYHIPQVCGVPVAIETVARLVGDFPGRIGGSEDSGADLVHTLELLAVVGDRAAMLVGACPRRCRPAPAVPACRRPSPSPRTAHARSRG